MLFIAHKPLQLILDEQKIIFATQHQLYLTTFHFIQQYLTATLASQHPLHLQYSSEKSQILVGTTTSLELYWSDWEHKIELHLVIILNNQKIYSIQWNSIWEVFGQFKQYSPSGVRLWKVKSIDNELPSCFSGEKQFLIANNKLFLYDHKKNKHNSIEWKDSHNFIKTINTFSTLKAHFLYQNRYLIQFNNIVIYLSNNEVLHTFHHDGEVIVNSNMVSWVNNGNIQIYKIQEREVHNLGLIDAFDGHYYGSIVHHEKLSLLFYAFKEMTIKQLNFSENEEKNQTKVKNQKKDILSFESEPYKDIAKKNNQSNLKGNICIRQKDNPLFDSKSSISGHSIKALKESIGKFQVELQKSYDQQQKFNDDPSRPKSLTNVRLAHLDNKGMGYYRSNHGRNKSKESFGNNSISLGGHQQFEQPLESFDQINDIQQHLSSLLASSNPLDYVQTPAFQMNQHGFGGDTWGAFQSAWPKGQYSRHFSKTSEIQVIEEQIDDNHGILAKKESFVVQEEVIPSNKSPPRSASMSIQVIEQNLDFEVHNRQSKPINKILSSHIFDFDPLVSQQYQKNDSRQIGFLNKQLANSSYSDRSERKKKVLTSKVLKDINKQDIKEQEIFKDHIEQFEYKEQSFAKKQRSKLTKMKRCSNVGLSIENDFENHSQIKTNSIVQKDVSHEFSNKSKIIQEVREPIQIKKKYTQILGEIYRKQPNRFEEELQKCLGNLILEKQASLFFAEHIRNFNPTLTKEKLLRLYCHIQNTAENRQLMTKALRQFKLEEVPSECLSFNDNIVEIFRIIQPTVYLQDLLEPSVRLIQSLIQSYFTKNIKKMVIKIQDQSIQLGHPRNLLNVLLYLNEYFKLPISIIFEIYAKQMMKHQQIMVIKKIINSDILALCEISESVFEKAAQLAARQILQQKNINYNRLEKIIDLMDEKNKKLFTDIINIIQDFTLIGILFDIPSILELQERRNLFDIMKDIINTNTAETLAKANLPSILGMLYKLQNGRNMNYYNEESIEITKLFSKKLIEMSYIKEGIYNLMPIAAVVSTSFVAALLIKSLNGKYVNRLVHYKFSDSESFTKIFEDLLSSKGKHFLGDKQNIFCQKQLKTKQWKQFKSFCQQCLQTTSWQLCFLIYRDIDLAHQLIDEQILTQNQFQQLCRKLGDEPNKYKYMKSIKAKSQVLKIPLGSEVNQSNQSQQIRQPVCRQISNKKKKSKFELSILVSNPHNIQIEDRSNTILCRSMLNNNEQDTDPVLYGIKFEVNPQQSLKLLREYYYQSSSGQFFHALKLVDRQKLGIISKNVDIFKSIDKLNLNFKIKQLVPFEYFFDASKSWLLIQDYLQSQLNFDNFWVFFLLVGMLYGKVESIVTMLIQKTIYYFKSDIWAISIKEILDEVDISKQFLKGAAEAAEQRGLTQVGQVLVNKIFKFI